MSVVPTVLDLLRGPLGRSGLRDWGESATDELNVRKDEGERGEWGE